MPGEALKRHLTATVLREVPVQLQGMDGLIETHPASLQRITHRIYRNIQSLTE